MGANFVLWFRRQNKLLLRSAVDEFVIDTIRKWFPCATTFTFIGFEVNCCVCFLVACPLGLGATVLVLVLEVLAFDCFWISFRNWLRRCGPSFL
jgi:hypothetical protein